MEGDAALLPNGEKKVWKITSESIVEELKKVSSLAAPMVAVTVSENLLQVVSVMMVGHLGELSLSGVAIATSLTNVTGFSLLFGMAGALETLCGQSYGAAQYRNLGAYTYCAIISLLLICIPISIFWTFMDKILILIGQDPQVAQVACRYAMWQIPNLFGYAVLQALVRYYQSQSLIFPMLLSAVTTLGLHVPLCWVLIYKIKLGSIGAAISMGVACWFNALLLATYMRYSPTCQKTRGLSIKDIFVGSKEFFRFALPSAVMICLEWWSFEFLILLSGILPNSKLETSVLSICLTSTSLHYFVPYGFSAAASTRISNELGAGNPLAARLTILVSVALTITEAVLVGMTLFFCRDIFGYLYSNEKEVADYVRGMVPLLSVSLIMDSLVAVLSGVARGTGWQHLGAYANLGAYYLVGIPMAVVLCFVVNLRGKGLWIGIFTGSTVQAILLAIITTLTNWQKQASMARERIFDRKFPAANGLA